MLDKPIVKNATLRSTAYTKDRDHNKFSALPSASNAHHATILSQFSAHHEAEVVGTVKTFVYAKNADGEWKRRLEFLLYYLPFRALMDDAMWNKEPMVVVTAMYMGWGAEVTIYENTIHDDPEEENPFHPESPEGREWEAKNSREEYFAFQDIRMFSLYSRDTGDFVKNIDVPDEISDNREDEREWFEDWAKNNNVDIEWDG